MAEPLRHRQTKGAETDMPGLPPPRHIPTLPSRANPGGVAEGPEWGNCCRFAVAGAQAAVRRYRPFAGTLRSHRKRS